MRNLAVILLLALLLGACVTLGHIQQTQPIRVLHFSGSHDIVAKCVHQRLGGKLQNEFGDRFVIYDSAKAHEREGLTHYAVTVGRVSEGKGFAEWRIMRPARQAGPATTARPLSRAMVDQYWRPVQDCAAKAEGPL